MSKKEKVSAKAAAVAAAAAAAAEAEENSNKRKFDEIEEDEEEEGDGLGILGNLLQATGDRSGGLAGGGLGNLGGAGGNGLDDYGDAQDFEKEKMRLLLANFDEEQMSRYEVFRRANVNRGSVKKLANSILGQSITANVAVGLSGLSKVFIGEIVEKARDVQARMSPQEFHTHAPLRPEHLREAWRLFKIETGTVPASYWQVQGNEPRKLLFP